MSQHELEAEKLRREIRNISASTQKILAETRKIERERTLYPFVVGTGLILAFVGLFKALS